MNEEAERAASRLNELMAGAGLEPLDSALAMRFGEYCRLLLRWNARVNLTAIRDEDSILSRHFVESIACARALPAAIGTLLDFGSGAGFPGIPISLCRPEIAVTLAESQGKKAAFLQEAVRVTGASAKVFAGRSEALGLEFDCVTLRAVDRMELAVRGASQLVSASGWLALLTTGGELSALQAAAGQSFSWQAPSLLPGGRERMLALGVRQAVS